MEQNMPYLFAVGLDVIAVPLFGLVCLKVGIIEIYKEIFPLNVKYIIGR
jgi:hypothetical protein